MSAPAISPPPPAYRFSERSLPTPFEGKDLTVTTLSAALVVGLRNPGTRYESTRHNVGAMVLNVLARRATPLPVDFSAHRKTRCDIAQLRAGGRPLILAQPQSYMNESGGPVSAAAQYFSVAARDIIVVHDDLDLDVGTVRLKRGGGEGGHNGLRSCTKSLGTKDYLRVRVGIGRPPGRQAPADYVLKPFSTAQRTELALALELSADAVELLLSQGLEAAQNAVHGR